MKGSTLAIVVAFGLGLPASASADEVGPDATITVDSLTDLPANPVPDGACTLREAIDNANANTDVTGGDCASGGGIDLVVFDIDGTITLQATLPEITDMSSLTIDGDGAITIHGNGLFQGFRVMRDTGTFGWLNLVDLTIEGCIAPAGGAILNLGYTALSGVTLRSNRALTDGGAIFNGNGFGIAESVFDQNLAGGRGGAIYNGVASAGVDGSTFTGNKATDGGAIYNEAGAMHAFDSVFTGNEALVNGGALYASGAFGTERNEFSGNHAFGDGGAVFADGAVSVEESHLFENVAGGFGGAIGGSGAVGVDDSVLTSNTAGLSGGAISLSGSAFGVERSVLTDNVAGLNGGAIATENSATGVRRSTVAHNSAALHGGGVYMHGGPGSGLGTSLFNSTVADNIGEGWYVATSHETDATDQLNYYWSTLYVQYSTVTGNTRGGVTSQIGRLRIQGSIISDNGTANCTGPRIDDGYNLEFSVGGSDTCGFTNHATSGDPLLGPLKDNGGPTPTMAPGTGSPALDLVPYAQFNCVKRATGTSTAFATDQRGVIRAQGGFCDLGSVDLA